MTSRAIDASPVAQPFRAGLRGADLLAGMLVFLVAFGISLSLLGAYTGGDQLNYRAFYDEVRGVRADAVPIVQAMTTGSAEPLYGYLMWVTSSAGLDKDVVISVMNGILALVLFLFLRRYRAGVLPTVLIFTNFYLITLFTSLERLKLAYILLTLAMLVSGWKRALILFISMTAHFQSFLLIAAGAGLRVGSADFLRRYVTPLQLLLILMGIPVAIIGFLLFVLRFLPAIQGKMAAYQGGGVAELASMGLLIIVGVVVLRRKQAFLVGLIPIAMAAAVFGASRINVMAVTFLLYLAVTERRASHPLMLALLVYFSLKTIPFVENIYAWGDGYYIP
ncbi:EpsG family protein [Haematobacter genomosp. 1]|uniref:EpsG family protein n=1 Tax=Haematobacter genomosp. 1 TaxID=366618 RepID=A0A212AB58_9RHOB|nr:EpsG family protein [Haematobacter genomosp. 1]OWJ77748.1 hypothetical protein CDV49_10680 [Haematobacter genomosp. 1]